MARRQSNPGHERRVSPKRRSRKRDGASSNIMMTPSPALARGRVTKARGNERLGATTLGNPQPYRICDRRMTWPAVRVSSGTASLIFHPDIIHCASSGRNRPA